jgi:hypothetical protein
MCPGGSFGAVFGAVSPRVQAALHRFARVHLDLLEGIVREGMECGQFKIGEQRPPRHRHSDSRQRARRFIGVEDHLRSSYPR